MSENANNMDPPSSTPRIQASLFSGDVKISGNSKVLNNRVIGNDISVSPNANPETLKALGLGQHFGNSAASLAANGATVDGNVVIEGNYVASGRVAVGTEATEEKSGK